MWRFRRSARLQLSPQAAVLSVAKGGRLARSAALSPASGATSTSTPGPASSIFNAPPATPSATPTASWWSSEAFIAWLTQSGARGCRVDVELDDAFAHTLAVARNAEVRNLRERTAYARVALETALGINADQHTVRADGDIFSPHFLAAALPNDLVAALTATLKSAGGAPGNITPAFAAAYRRQAGAPSNTTGWWAHCNPGSVVIAQLRAGKPVRVRLLRSVPATLAALDALVQREILSSADTETGVEVAVTGAAPFTASVEAAGGRRYVRIDAGGVLSGASGSGARARAWLRPKPGGINFGSAPQLTRSAALLLLAGLAGMGAASYQCWQQREALTATRHSLQAAEQRLSTARGASNATPPALPAAQIKAVNEAVRRLNVPWSEIAQGIEEIRVPDTALLSIEPNARTGRMMVLAEAKNSDAMLALYQRALNDSQFADANLRKLEPNDKEALPVLRFMLDARWKVRP